jgi:hypothetical protein
MANRMINNEFLMDLMPGGVLSPVVELVKDKRLVLSFRCDCINVYHKSHSIYKIVQKKRPGQRYRIEFDFNHARYTESYVTDLEELKSLGFKLSNKTDNVAFDYYESGKCKSGNNKIYTYISSLDNQFWKNSSNILIKLVNDFFSNNEKDYFSGEVIKRERKNNENRFLEKKRQQGIALANQNADSPFFIYDLEYAEPNGKKKGVPGRFDMLGVYTEKRKVKNLFFIELKSTISACNAKTSGIISHESDMEKYLADDNKDVIDERKNEAIDILKGYNTLFNENSKLTFPINPQDIDVGAFFILTDEAITRKHKIKKFKNIMLENDQWKITQELCELIL